MSGGGFHRYEIAGHYKGLEWRSRVYGSYFARLSPLRSNSAESLWPKNSVSKDGVCLGSSSDRGWAAAVLTLDAWLKSCSQMSKIAGRGPGAMGGIK